MNGKYILLFSLTIIFSFFKISKCISLRNMISTESLDEICSKSSNEDLINFYKNDHYTSFTTDIKNIGEDIIELTKSVSSDSSSYEKLLEYFSKYPFIPNYSIVLAIILFILGILLSLLAFIQKYKKKVHKIVKNNQKIVRILGFIFTIIGLIICSFGLVINVSLLNKFYDVECSHLKIENHTLNGDEISYDGRWRGLKTVERTIKYLKNNIKATLDKYLEFSNDFENIQMKFKKLKDIIKKQNVHHNKKYINPDPNGQNNETKPSFLNSYGPLENPQSFLGQMSNEVKTKVGDNNPPESENIINILKELYNTNISESLINFYNNLHSYSYTVHEYNEELVKGYSDLSDDLFNYTRIGMTFFFGLNLIVLLGIGGLFILFLKKPKFKLFFYSFWGIMYLFLLLGMLFCGAFFNKYQLYINISETLFLLVKNEVKYEAAKNKNDTISIFLSMISNIPKVCVSGNGLLLNEEEFLETKKGFKINPKDIDKFSDLTLKLKDYINKISNTKIEITKKIVEEYESVLANPIEKISELNKEFQNISKFINESRIDKSERIEDKWGIVDSDCKNEEQYCIIISKKSLYYIREKYEGKIKSDAMNEINKYYYYITKFWEEIQRNLNSIISDSKLIDLLLEELNIAQINFIYKYSNASNPESHDSNNTITNITSIFNCGFFKRDVNKAFQQLYDSYGDTYMTVGLLILFLSITEFIISIFIMSFISGNKDELQKLNQDVKKVELIINPSEVIE